MNTNELTKIIEAMLDLEINKRIIKSSLEDLSNRISNLGKKRDIQKPQYSEPKYFEPKKQKLKERDINTTPFIVIVVLSIVSGLFHSFQLELSAGSSTLFFSTLLRGILIVPLHLVFGLLIGGIVTIIFEVYTSISERMESKRKYQNDINEAQNSYEQNKIYAQKRYKQEIIQYEEDLKNESIRIKQELEHKKNLQADMQLLSFRLESIDDLLKEMYDHFDILPQYRNIIAIGYMNDLLKIGSATQLKGPNQLYEKVRRDMREDRIPAAIGELSFKLDTIINQNNRLYSTVQSISREQATLCDAIDQGSRTISNSLENSLSHATSTNNSDAALAYETKLIRKELQYQNYMLRN